MGLFSKIGQGLKKTRDSLMNTVSSMLKSFTRIDEDLFEELSAQYDYIFVDTPPVTVVTEAAAMAKNANGVIVVIRQNSTIHESIERALTNLKMADAKILGYILNGVEHSAYGYKTYNHKYKQYGYRYGYGYGYGEKESKSKDSKKK